MARPKLKSVGNNAWTFKGAKHFYASKKKANKARNKMYPKKADVYKRAETYNVRDSSGKMQTGVSAAAKDKIVAAGGKLQSTVKGPKKGYNIVKPTKQQLLDARTDDKGVQETTSQRDVRLGIKSKAAYKAEVKQLKSTITKATHEKKVTDAYKQAAWSSKSLEEKVKRIYRQAAWSQKSLEEKTKAAYKRLPWDRLSKKEKEKIYAEVYAGTLKAKKSSPKKDQAKLDQLRKDIKNKPVEFKKPTKKKTTAKDDASPLMSSIMSKADLAKLVKERVAAQADAKKAEPKPDRSTLALMGIGGTIYADMRPLALLADTLYKDANFKTKAELNEDIKKYGSISSAKANTPPPTRKEAIARMSLAILDPIIGGYDEATLLAHHKELTENRPGTAGLRIVGALATPTAADMVVGAVLNKLTLTSRARGVLNKVDKFLVEKGDPLYGDAFKAAKRLTPADVRFIDDMEAQGLIPRTMRLGEEAIDDLYQLIKMDVKPTGKQFEAGMNKFRDAARKELRELKLATKFLDEGNAVIDDIVDALKKGYDKSRATLIDMADDPVLARAKARTSWEDAVTQAQRLSQRKVGPDDLPFFRVEDFVKFTEEGLTADRRTALKLMDLQTFLNKGEARANAVKNFIELNVGQSRRGFSTLAPPDLSKLYVDVDDLLTFMGDNPALFSDGALVTALLPTLSKKDATKLLKESTNLPDGIIDVIVSNRKKKIDYTAYMGAKTKKDMENLLEKLKKDFPEIGDSWYKIKKDTDNEKEPYSLIGGGGTLEEELKRVKGIGVVKEMIDEIQDIKDLTKINQKLEDAENDKDIIDIIDDIKDIIDEQDDQAQAQALIQPPTQKLTIPTPTITEDEEDEEEDAGKIIIRTGKGGGSEETEEEDKKRKKLGRIHVKFNDGKQLTIDTKSFIQAAARAESARGHKPFKQVVLTRVKK